jgi:hypothetical protein
MSLKKLRFAESLFLNDESEKKTVCTKNFDEVMILKITVGRKIFV